MPGGPRNGIRHYDAGDRRFCAGRKHPPCQRDHSHPVHVCPDDLPAKQRGFRLVSYPNKTFSRAQLMDEFWGVESETSLRAVDVYITKLRDKFSACDGFEIRTVRGLGYKAVLR